MLKALAARGGMLGLSLYPHHLKGGSECTLESFTAMVARLADLIGVDHIGIGSDLCQDQPDSVVAWMRNGRWTKSDASIGLGAAVFPPQPAWFRDNRDFGKIRAGLHELAVDLRLARRIADLHLAIAGNRAHAQRYLLPAGGRKARGNGEWSQASSRRVSRGACRERI